MKYLKLVVLLSFVFIYGCSNKYVVTYDSTPQGATLICNGKSWGETPKKLYYDEIVKTNPTFNIGSCSANWVSGASQDYPSSLNIFPSGGTIINVNRPAGDGYASDAQYALQLRQTRAIENASAPAVVNSTKTCKKFGDLSGRVYQFDTGFCPYGYY